MPCFRRAQRLESNNAVIERGPDYFSPKLRSDLRHKPGFHDARTRLIKDIVFLHKSDTSRHRLLSDRGRVFVAFFCLHLHGMPNGNGIGLTMSRLEAACLKHEVCSAARARATVQLMLRAKYLTVSNNTEDGRIKPLEPTELLRAYFAERWRINIAALADIDPKFADAPAAAERHTFRDCLCELLGQAHQTGSGLPAEPDGLAEIAELDSGLMIMLRLAQAGCFGEPAPSANALSREFGISRAHVSNILRTAERAGLIERDPARTTVSVLPPLCERISDYCAATLLLYEWAVPEALALESARLSGL